MLSSEYTKKGANLIQKPNPFQQRANIFINGFNISPKAFPDMILVDRAIKNIWFQRITQHSGHRFDLRWTGHKIGRNTKIKIIGFIIPFFNWKTNVVFFAGMGHNGVIFSNIS